MAEQNAAVAGETRVHHEGSPLLYALVWLALLILTVATYLLSRASLSHSWHLIAALSVAVVKSTLVALFFMHLAYHGGANRLVLLTAVFFVALLVGLTVADNATRFPLANPPRDGTAEHLPPVARPPRPPPEPNRLPEEPGPGFW